MKSIRFVLTMFCLSFFIQEVSAQEVSKETIASIESFLTNYARKDIQVGYISIDSVRVLKKEIRIYDNANCSYIPFREINVKEIYIQINKLLPAKYSKYKLKLITDNHSIEELIPLALKKNKHNQNGLFTNKVDKPLVSRVSLPYRPTMGLQNKHIALWQSHGHYFEQKLDRWEWQRARIFQTVEDLYTQSFVLPYLVPMLENAGANVLMPRERDVQTNEIIVDNDGNKDHSSYSEISSTKCLWEQGELPGFAYKKDQYVVNENPFTEGTYRRVSTTHKGKISTAEWVPEIPQAGKYGVYVSYKTLPNSTDDALYTVYHKGGATQFRINQTMGGGTWVFLGYFNFDAGYSNSMKVVLSNQSRTINRVVTADAVKIGGGYGNIARKVNDALVVSDNKKSSDSTVTNSVQQMPKIEYQYQKSGYPRYTEAARYWLQWAGFPASIYTTTNGENDYVDDYKCRGEWVNYISGGSTVSPTHRGLNIPIDLAFAFHSDAGTTQNDSIIGTLGIFCTNTTEDKFKNNSSRYTSRDLTDLIQSQIVNDVRRCYEPEWTRRGMWNKSYSEARTPNVPTMLLELLSHQNFADMRYGLDPRFRFTVSRAIYKGMLQFVSSQYKKEYVVQPLPVDHFSARFVGNNRVELNWRAVADSLESTAVPDKYIVYTRIGQGDFDNGVVVDKSSYVSTQQIGVQYAYKITALNKGGESFPSEILSAYRAPNEKGVVLIVNGFDRVSGPADFVSQGIAGFYDALDHGVPDKQDICYIGSQNEYRRQIPWMDDDAAGFGASYGNYEKTVIAGNSFDYPAMHGEAISAAGYSYVSSSNESVIDSLVSLRDYTIVDLILGKQKQVKVGRGVHSPQFKTFSKELQTAISDFCKAGGNIYISGAYVATDLWDNGKALPEDLRFAKDILKYQWRTGQAATEGKVKSVSSPFAMIKGNYSYYNTPNSKSYVVESPDAIEPAGADSYTIFRYSENNLSAGVAFKGKYKTCVLGFPFESINSRDQRDELMRNVLFFFSANMK